MTINYKKYSAESIFYLPVPLLAFIFNYFFVCLSFNVNMKIPLQFEQIILISNGEIYCEITIQFMSHYMISVKRYT